MVGAVRVVVPDVFSTVAVVLSTVSLIATATATLTPALAVLVELSVSVDALLFDEATTLMA